MSWFALLSAAIKLVSSIAVYLREGKLISAGEARLLADALEMQAYEIEIGRAARLAQREHDSRGVSDDEPDPFRRD